MYDGGCELVSDKESNELHARSDFKNKFDGPNDEHGLLICVANVRRAIKMALLIFHVTSEFLSC